MTMPDTPALAALREADRHAENEVLHLALRLANWDPPSVMDLKDAPLLEAHARALIAYRDAVAARVRAELLASGTPLWVATDGRANQLCCLYASEPFFDECDRLWRVDGIDDDEATRLPAPLTPPGTCRRAVLTILPGEAR